MVRRNYAAQRLGHQLSGVQCSPCHPEPTSELPVEYMQCAPTEQQGIRKLLYLPFYQEIILNACVNTEKS